MTRNIRRCIEACREFEIRGDDCEGASARRASTELALLVSSREYLRQALREAIAEAEERKARLRRRAEAKRLVKDPLRFRTRPSWHWQWAYTMDWPYQQADATREVNEDHVRIMAHLRERPRLP